LPSEYVPAPPPRLHLLAAIDDHRRHAGARELVRAEQAGRARADDHDGLARGLAERRTADRVLAGHADREVKPHAAAPRVDRALAHLERR
jgi:hypothetical protein